MGTRLGTLAVAWTGEQSLKYKKEWLAALDDFRNWLVREAA